LFEDVLGGGCFECDGAGHLVIPPGKFFGARSVSTAELPGYVFDPADPDG
jgi:hypothetical protein